MNLRGKLILTEIKSQETEHNHLILRLRCESCQQQFSIDVGISLGYTKYIWANLMRELMNHAYDHMCD
jgi:transposase-like protein